MDVENDEARRFVKLPIPSFRFIESCAYRSCVDPDHVYAPVQATDARHGVWRIGIRQPQPEPEQVCMLPDPEHELFGSKLLSDGRLVICSFQGERLLIVDVHTGALVDQIPLPAAPNDVAYDPADEAILYVCVNSSRYGDQHALNALRVASHDLGDIFRVDLRDRSVVRVASGLEVMAGIAVVGEELWVSELYRLVRVDPRTGSWERLSDTHDPRFLADNLTHFSGRGGKLILPMYRQASWLEVWLSQSNVLSRLAYRLVRNVMPSLAAWLAEPGEVEDVRFGIYDVEAESGHLLRLDLNPKKRFGPDRAFPDDNFDGAVTHIERADDTLVLINYRSRWVMMVPVASLPLDDPQPLRAVMCG